MNFSTVPPWRSSTVRISSKYRPITRRIDSGSSCSPSEVEPVTSANRTVTVLRTSPPGAAGSPSGAEQKGQNTKSAGLSRPQLGQVRTRRV